MLVYHNSACLWIAAGPAEEKEERLTDLNAMAATVGAWTQSEVYEWAKKTLHMDAVSAGKLSEAIPSGQALWGVADAMMRVRKDKTAGVLLVRAEMVALLGENVLPFVLLNVLFLGVVKFQEHMERFCSERQW